MKWNKDKSLILTQIMLYLFAAVLLALDIFIYPLAKWRVSFRGAENPMFLIIWIMVIIYTASIFGWIFLYQMHRLLRNISNGIVFSSDNVRFLRIVSWCLFAAALIFAVGTAAYFIFFFLGAAAAFIGLVVRIVKNAFQQAVEMKSELDLTI